MRTQKEMLDLILTMAKEDAQIRAVTLTGSQVYPNEKKDCFQDFDVRFIVKDIKPFIEDRSWIEHFGEIMIIDMLDRMEGQQNERCFIYLMQFMDGNRVDLTISTIEACDLSGREPMVALIDKDNLLSAVKPIPEDIWAIEPPTSQQFYNCCIKFWWFTLNVAKGIWRVELAYTKEFLDCHVRSRFIGMLNWYIGLKTNFKKNTGSLQNKHYKEYLDAEEWKSFESTYADYHYDNIWDSLFEMCALFRKAAVRIAEYYGYEYPYEEDRRITAYLRHVERLPGDAKSIY